MNVGNLISDFFAFSKSSLYIWNFSIHILLMPSLKDFEHNLARVSNKHNCTVFWTFFGIAFFRNEMKSDLFKSYGHWWVFQICWHIECISWPASSLRIWNNLAASPSLVLFIVILSKGTWLHTPGPLVLGEWPHRHDYPSH